MAGLEAAIAGADGVHVLRTGPHAALIAMYQACLTPHLMAGIGLTTAAHQHLRNEGSDVLQSAVEEALRCVTVLYLLLCMRKHYWLPALLHKPLSTARLRNAWLCLDRVKRNA